MAKEAPKKTQNLLQQSTAREMQATNRDQSRLSHPLRLPFIPDKIVLEAVGASELHMEFPIWKYLRNALGNILEPVGASEMCPRQDHPQHIGGCSSKHHAELSLPLSAGEGGKFEDFI